MFYVLVAVLFISAGLCVWVGWCFKNDSFPFLWPIKVARIVVSVFVSMFYIASLNIFLIAVQCKPEVDAKGHKSWKHLIYHLGALRRGAGGVCGRPAWVGSVTSLSLLLPLLEFRGGLAPEPCSDRRGRHANQSEWLPVCHPP